MDKINTLSALEKLFQNEELTSEEMESIKTFTTCGYFAPEMCDEHRVMILESDNANIKAAIQQSIKCATEQIFKMRLGQ